MRPENSQDGAFAVGDRVQEVGTGLRGVIVRRGEFAGEWRLQLESGQEVVCLESNLVPATPPAAG